MIIEIDTNSGFCNGVVRAIRKAEEELEGGKTLYCLGDIVHNSHEVNRLKKRGLTTIDKQQFEQLHDECVLLRAHGEPPSTYRMAEKNNITIIDATCQVVLKLQQRIREAYLSHPESQIVIFGKHGHAEVLGLVGQTDNNAIVVDNDVDVEKIDFAKSVILFSQTTKSVDDFQHIITLITQRLQPNVTFQYYDTICRQVANRLPKLREFATHYNKILFVGDVKSSNGKMLYEECCKVNTNVHFISSVESIDYGWFDCHDTVGICGATSTPKWQMEEVANCLSKQFNN
ncbi:MAG: 4-hydroxy-3-methylbut-2-enyl diphosphate reductase [Bacteroidales bacterium]|nr:4-hydroxy-3-methylbut-2-enyl diphosphate reductase [Bacteroidales bacterium]